MFAEALPQPLKNPFSFALSTIFFLIDGSMIFASPAVMPFLVMHRAAVFTPPHCCSPHTEHFLVHSFL